MEEIAKLPHLIDHWMEHNEEHVKTYLHWADIAERSGKNELARILREIAGEYGKLEGLLRKAKEASG